MNLNTRKSKKLVRSVAMLALLVIIAATPLLGRDKKLAAVAKPMDIVDTAVEAGQFKTLAAALGAAGLIDALKRMAG